MVAGVPDGGNSGCERRPAGVAQVSRLPPSQTPIYKPYRDEIPWELLLAADPDEARVDAYAHTEFMRVAKLNDAVIGVYVVAAMTPTRYQLLNLSVAEGYRRKGLGGWLLGHAIGLAETKGAREIFVASTPLRGLFTKIGFAAVDADLLLTLTPE